MNMKLLVLQFSGEGQGQPLIAEEIVRSYTVSFSISATPIILYITLKFMDALIHWKVATC